jgi:hypothetical protein
MGVLSGVCAVVLGALGTLAQTQGCFVASGRFCDS